MSYSTCSKCGYRAVNEDDVCEMCSGEYDPEDCSLDEQLQIDEQVIDLSVDGMCRSCGIEMHGGKLGYCHRCWHAINVGEEKVW